MYGFEPPAERDPLGKAIGWVVFVSIVVAVVWAFVDAVTKGVVR